MSLSTSFSEQELVVVYSTSVGNFSSKMLKYVRELGFTFKTVQFLLLAVFCLFLKMGKIGCWFSAKIRVCNVFIICLVVLFKRTHYTFDLCFWVCVHRILVVYIV